MRVSKVTRMWNVKSGGLSIGICFVAEAFGREARGMAGHCWIKTAMGDGLFLPGEKSPL